MSPIIGPPGPILGPVARGAVVAGTATAVATGVKRHQEQKYAMEDAERAEREAGAGVQSDYISELQRLGELKASGLITAEEFEAKKKRILGI